MGDKLVTKRDIITDCLDKINYINSLRPSKKTPFILRRLKQLQDTIFIFENNDIRIPATISSASYFVNNIELFLPKHYNKPGDIVESHLDKRSIYSGVKIPAHDKQSKYRQSRRAQGLCPRCGNKPETDKVLCNTCSEKKNKYFNRKIYDHNNNEDFLLHNSFLALEKLGFEKDEDVWDGEFYEVVIYSLKISERYFLSIILNFIKGNPDGPGSVFLYVDDSDYEIELHTNQISHIKVLLKMLTGSTS